MEHKFTLIESHKKANLILHKRDEIEFWQDKILEMKILKKSEGSFYKKKIEETEKELKQHKDHNQNLKNEINSLKERVDSLSSEIEGSKDKYKQISEEIVNYESKNVELYNEFLNVNNLIRNLENPENLIKHLLKFDRQTLNSLCIKLNNVHHEKLYSQMMMQQQYFNQYYYNAMNTAMTQKSVEYNINNINSPSSPQNGNKEQH